MSKAGSIRLSSKLSNWAKKYSDVRLRSVLDPERQPAGAAVSWRTVVVSSRCELDLKMGYMVVRGDTVRRVFLDEIALLLIENPAVSLTGCLLSALMERKVKVIFCDSSRSPQAELVPYYGSHDTSRKIMQQIAWPEEVSGAVWTAIAAEKIRRQAALLRAARRLCRADGVPGRDRSGGTRGEGLFQRAVRHGLHPFG